MQAIRRGEDRERFKEIVRKVGGDVPRSAVCGSLEEVLEAAGEPASFYARYPELYTEAGEHR